MVSAQSWRRACAVSSRWIALVSSVGCSTTPGDKPPTVDPQQNAPEAPAGEDSVPGAAPGLANPDSEPILVDTEPPVEATPPPQAGGPVDPPQLELISVDRTRGKLPDEVVDQLRAGGPASGMEFLYPYDKTVFPGGTLAPLLQWSPAAGPIDAIYLHIYSEAFDYKEVFEGTPTAALELPQDVWEAAYAQSQGASDPTTVELTTLSGSVVSGPISQRWIFARGQLKSAIYYNTYDSASVMPSNGAVMRIQPMARAPEVIKTVQGGNSLLGPCYSCHSLSADGQTLVAQRHQYPGGPYSSESFDVAANPGIDPPPMASSSVGYEDWGFSALYPDGSKTLTAGQPSLAGGFLAPFPFAPENNPAMLGPRDSMLIDTRTGASLGASGLVQYAMMPSFSPDGSRVVFNDYDNGQGHSLSVMDFDNDTNTFSNRREIFRDTTLYPGWPFFTPDGARVIFALGDGSDFATVQDPPTGLQLNHSDLFEVDVASGGEAIPLSLASGAALSPRDQRLNYYPTVSPVAAGGYFWVFFTSRRTYGNVMAQPETDPKTKKIWVAALDIDTGAVDPSHPAFYLPGQELTSGNIRAFATLSPCHSDGDSCTSGIDCCGGFCVDGTCGTPTGCFNLDDKCESGGDCCEGLRCIGGHCSNPPPMVR